MEMNEKQMQKMMQEKVEAMKKEMEEAKNQVRTTRDAYVDHGVMTSDHDAYMYDVVT